MSRYSLPNIKTLRRSTRRKRVPDRLGVYGAMTAKQQRVYRGGTDGETLVMQPVPLPSGSRKRRFSTSNEKDSHKPVANDTDEPLDVDELVSYMKQKHGFTRPRLKYVDDQENMVIEIGRYKFTVSDVIDWLSAGNRRMLRFVLLAAYESDSVRDNTDVDYLEVYGMMLKYARPKFITFLMQVVEQLLQNDSSALNENVQILLSPKVAGDKEHITPWNILNAAIHQWHQDLVDLTIAVSKNDPNRWFKIWSFGDGLEQHLITMFQRTLDKSKEYPVNGSSKTLSAFAARDIYRYERAIQFNLWAVLASRGVMIDKQLILITYAQYQISSPLKISSTLMEDLTFFLEQQHHPTSEPRLAYSLFTYYDYSTVLRTLNTRPTPRIIQYLMGKHEVWYPDFYRNLQYVESLSVAKREVIYLWTEHCGVLQAGSTTCNVSAYSRQQLDEILELAPRNEHEFYVYRGVKAATIDEASGIALSHQDQYIATSFDLSKAWGFSNTSTLYCIYRIRVQKGTPFLMIHPRVSAFEHEESEILFPRSFQLIQNILTPTDSTLSGIQSRAHINPKTFPPLYDFDLIPVQITQPDTTQLKTQSEEEIWLELVNHILKDIAENKINDVTGVFDSIRTWQLKWYGASTTLPDEVQHSAFRKFAKGIIEKMPIEVFEELYITRQQAHDNLNNYKLYSKVTRR